MGLRVVVEITCGFLVVGLPVVPRFFKQEPFFTTLASILRFIRRRRSSRTGESGTERLGSSDAPTSKSNGIVTDIEFNERTDMSRVTVDHVDVER
jgi:hypothetical protein